MERVERAARPSLRDLDEDLARRLLGRDPVKRGEHAGPVKRLDRVDVELDRAVGGPVAELLETLGVVQQPELELAGRAAEERGEADGSAELGCPGGLADEALRGRAADEDELAGGREVSRGLAEERGLVADEVED